MSRKTRKLMWSMPLIAAVAVIGALALFLTQEPDGASAQQMELPGMVQNLKVEPYTDGIPQEKLEVTWDPPTGGVPVTGYRIDLSLDGSRWLSHVVNQGTTNLSRVYPEGTDNLKAGQTRHFRVFALNEHGTGPGISDSGSTAASNVPDRPTGLMATDGTGTISITVFDLNGNGKIDTTPVDDVNEIELGFDVDGDGELEADVDGVSETFTAVDVAQQTAIMLSWTAPEDPPGAPVSGYKIEYSINGENWYTLVENAPNRMDYFDTNLRAGTQRQYRIYAKNSVGTSAVSDKALGETAAGAAPGDVTEVVIGLSPASTDVHLKWTPPGNPPGAPITHYRIQARLSSGDDADYKAVHTGTHIAAASEYNFGGRGLSQAGISYPASIAADDDELVEVNIRIAAINSINAETADGATGVNWVSLVEVPVGHEDAPLPPAAPAVRLDRTQNEGRSGLNVTWDKATFITDDAEPTPPDPTDAQISYVLVINGMDQPAVTHAEALPRGGSEVKPGHDDDRLAAETTRKYNVYAVNTTITVTGASSVRSFPSVESQETTARPQLPGPPGSFTAIPDGHTEIRLRWAAPTKSADDCSAGAADPADMQDDGSECGASVLDGYKVEMSEDGQTGWTTLAEKHKASPYLAKMLLPDSEYHFRVSAVNSRGAGMMTAVKFAKTHPPGEPTPPGGLVAQAYGYDTLKICWYEQDVLDPLIGEEARDEGLPILGYQISYVMADGSEMVVVANTMSKDTQWMQSGLGGETTRTYRVRSITLGGVGTKYAEATATTAEGPPSTALTAPTMVEAMGGTGELTVTWVDGENAVGHLVLLLDGADIEAMETAPTGNSHTFTGLSAGVYTAVVVSYKSTSDYDYDYDADSVQ